MSDIELKLLLDGKQHDATLLNSDKIWQQLRRTALDTYNKMQSGSKPVEGSLGAMRERLERLNSIFDRTKVGSDRFNSIAAEVGKTKDKIREAEAQAAFMAERKDVYAVGSSDHDALLFGAPYLIQNLTLAQKKKLPSGAYIKIQPEMIVLKDILEDLKINQDQLIILGIMIGTDYNRKGIFRVGAKKALKLVKENNL